jgi:ATP-dependent helicase/DNAse subunit B
VASPVELIVGPARSGKAGRVLEAYRAALARSGPGQCLMLVPTALRRRATESRLLAAQEAGVLFRPQVLTMRELADRLLTAAGRPVRRITELARRQVIRECLDRLTPKEAEAIRDVRGTPGLVDALDALFRELKAARVEPDAFGRAITERMRTPRNRLLVLLYDRYQKALQAHDVYDDAGQFWHAAALVQEGEFGPFGRLALLAVDGFQDFAPAQLDMLEALSQQAERTLITLTWEADRENLFGVTARTRDRLREWFGERLTETAASDASRLPPSLDRVRTHLFRLPDQAGAPAADGTISIIRAAGRTREVEEVARQAVDLVRGGADRPASIAVIARSLEAYADLVRQVFPRYGLSFRVENKPALKDCPVVRAAMALVRLQGEDYSYRAVARLVKSNYFVPAAFGADAETARAAVRLARDANVWKGRESYAKGFAYLRSLLDRQAGALDDTGQPVLAPEHAAARRAEIGRAEAMVGRLFAALALPPQATRRALADSLRRILREAGLWTAAAENPSVEGRARDLKALAVFEELLDEVALLDEQQAAPVPLDAFLKEVTQGLGPATISAAEPPDAPVVVLDARQSRALSFDHVFVIGLAEKEFPRRGRRHPFFDDAERRDLRERGVDLPDTGHQAEQEMLLFYVAATRARKTLALAYSSLDVQGRPILASHYLEELKGLFAPGDGGEPLPLIDISTRDLDLAAERLRAPPELLASTMFRVWGPDGRGGIDAGLAVLDAMLSRGPAAETALAGLAAEWEREHGEAFGVFDGVLAAEEILDDLCRRFPGQAVMSAARLEEFGACPFAFLAGTVLGLKPIEEPSPDLGPLDVGLIYHGLLERFFRALAKSKTLGGRLTEANHAAALALLDETAGAYFKHLESHGRIGSAALWQVQKRNILRDVRGLVDWHIERLAGWRAAYMEVQFGARTAGDVEPPGRRDPIAVDGPHGPVRLSGRIDRIDLAAEGEPGYQVIDYKSGAAPSKREMQTGTSFQLPIYLWAAEAMLAATERADLARAFFLPVRHPAQTGLLTTDGTKKFPDGTVAPAQERAAEYIRRFIDAMRHGQFPVYPRNGCPAHCDLSEICRYAEWRIERKWQLHPIAGLAPIEDEAAEAGEADA